MKLAPQWDRIQDATVACMYYNALCAAKPNCFPIGTKHPHVHILVHSWLNLESILLLSMKHKEKKLKK